MGFDVQCHPDYLLWLSGEFSCFFSIYYHFAFKEKEILSLNNHHSGSQMRGSQIVFALTLIFKVRSNAKREKWCCFEVDFIC